MKKLLLILLALALIASSIVAQSVYDYSDLINSSFIPKTKNDRGNFYSHKGVWFGFSLPEKSDSKNYGAFGGPYNIYTQQWLAPKLFQAEVQIKGQGTINLAKAIKIDISQYPGLLKQDYQFDNFNLTQKLTFVNEKTSLYVSEVINTANQNLDINLFCKGSIFENIGKGKETQNGWIIELINESDGVFLLQFRVEGKMEMEYNETEYTLNFSDFQTLKPNDTLRIVSTLTHVFMYDTTEEIKSAVEALNDFVKPFEQNEIFWDFFIANFEKKENNYSKLAIKCLETIWMNYKSKSPQFSNVFVTSNNHDCFNVKLMDIFIYSMCFNFLDKKLASNQTISFMNWFWNKKSMRLNNEFYFRQNDSLPHTFADFNLGPWLAWNIYNADKSNVTILDELIAEFEDLNENWYLKYDENKNLWCENDEKLESVILNAFLFSEKLSIKNILSELGFKEKAENKINEINYIRQNFDLYFYDNFSGEYCDIDYVNSKLIPNKKAFPYVIWSGLGAYTSIEQYINKNFNNYKIPEDNNLFFEKENLYSYYFLLSGLHLYKYQDLATNIKNQYIEKINSEVIKNNNKFFIYDKGEKIENTTVEAAITLMIMLYF
ncbi:MAG: hypothetical protein LBV69_08775 [Bacteroidales bacterium]|jgi:hypothetical protein|nr:hypothetical protein [Bacteroidales bacterium]